MQAWQPSSPEAPSAAAGTPGHTDDLTFGPGASTGKISWDQFDANEKLFGVTTSFDEHAYTTPLNRDAPDFKEKEKKAQQLANEILGVRRNQLVYLVYITYLMLCFPCLLYWSSITLYHLETDLSLPLKILLR